MKFVLVFCLLAVVASATETAQSGFVFHRGEAELLQFDALVAEAAARIVASNVTACWRNTIVRGVGTPIDSCKCYTDTPDKSGLLCYPNCKNGFNGVGPVCWENCKPGFTDEGALCGKDGKIVEADNSACPWYDKCGLVTAKGCSKCPSADYHNDGCTCRIDPVVYAKASYGRGAGKPLGCAPPKVYDAGLCYPPCKANYTGIGPVCWETCPGQFPREGGAMCCVNATVCNNKVVELATSVITAVASAIEAGLDPAQVMKAIKDAIDMILGFVMPLCYE